jgi:hypothetical protein
MSYLAKTSRSPLIIWMAPRLNLMSMTRRTYISKEFKNTNDAATCPVTYPPILSLIKLYNVALTSVMNNGPEKL